MPPTNIAYINLHFGTRMNMDAICDYNGWNIIHLHPSHDYEMSDELAENVWRNYYKPAIMDNNIDTIIVGDITTTCGYPVLRHLHELSGHVRVVLQVTNYFYYGNAHKPYIINNMRDYMRHPQVLVTYIDPFIIKTIWDFDIIPRRYKYIPLSGRVIEKQNRCIQCPCLTSGKPIDFDISNFYISASSPKIPQNDCVLIGNDDLAREIQANGGSIDNCPPRSYGGPIGLSRYYCAIYVPYHYSTMTLQELLSTGLTVFVPSLQYFRNTSSLDTLLMDTYHGPLSHLLQHYDSIPDLVAKLRNISNMPIMKKDAEKQRLKDFMKHYDENIFQQWNMFISG